MNFYRRYPGDYSRDTGHLSLAEHGAYTVLLDHYYGTSMPLPGALTALYRICRAMDEAEQAAVRTIADAFFPLAEDGCRHNRRADEELAVSALRAEANRANGKAGGRPRENPPDNPTETQSVSETEPTNNPFQNPDSNSRIQIPEATSEPARKAPGAPRRKTIPPDFPIDDFRAFAKAETPDVNFDAEMATLRDHEFRDAHSDWAKVVRNWLRREQKAINTRKGYSKPVDPPTRARPFPS
jgi:uncharacterized protein YdaU (DUF1376 family)